MSRIPIRIRLTAWFVAVIAVILVVLGSFVVTRLRADLTSEIDRSLTVSAAQIGEGYRDEGTGGFDEATKETMAAPGARTVGAQILDAGGKVVLSAGADVMRAPPPSLGLAYSAMAGNTSAESFTLAGERSRSLAVPAQVAGRPGALIVVEPLEAVDRAVHRALLLLLIGGGVALLLAGIGGWHVAGRALRPVERMAVRADMIDIEDLDQRVFVPAARDELRHLAQTLNAMLDRIKDGVAAKERLIADTSHELRGPLAAMRAELDVSLRHDDLDPQARALLESQREEVARLARIVDNLLTLARIDEGHLALMQSPNDVLALAQRAVRAHCATADRAGVALLASGERVEVSCDPDRIGQVLGNLLDNAVRVSPPGETVDVRVTREGEEARIEVSDRGPGVPAPERERIFERFARLDAARSRDAGAGLGLAICREVVAAHGGRLELAEPDGTGSTFVVTLPTAGPLTAPVSSH